VQSGEHLAGLGPLVPVGAVGISHGGPSDVDLDPQSGGERSLRFS
jgi:hypothetical protein